MSADAAGSPGPVPQQPAPEGGTAEVIARFGHSLRTPLNAIIGYAQILTMDPSRPLSPVQTERVERILEAGWQLAKLIDEMVERARAEAGHPGGPEGGSPQAGAPGEAPHADERRDPHG